MAPVSIAATAPLEATVVPRRIDLTLEPVQLGRVRVTLRLVEGQAFVRIVATTEAGFAALNADRDALLPMLRDVRGGQGELRIVLQADPASPATATETWMMDRSDRAAERWTGDRAARHERDDSQRQTREQPQRERRSEPGANDDTL